MDGETLILYRGETAEFTLSVERDGVPYDLTGASIEIEVKILPGADDPALIHLAVGNGITPLAPLTDGNAAVRFESTTIPVAANMPAGIYYLDVVTIKGADRFYPIKARRTILKDVVDQP